MSPLTAAQAPLIMLGVHFVDLAIRRRIESEVALSTYGIKSHYGELPDGELGKWHANYYRHIMGIMIVSLVHKHDITAIATPGARGFDGHPDHIAVHEAAVEARDILRNNGRDVTLLELNADNAGELVVPVRRPRKLSALALHASQMPLTPEGILDPTFWEQYPVYVPLTTRETYDIKAA